MTSPPLGAITLALAACTSAIACRSRDAVPQPDPTGRDAPSTVPLPPLQAAGASILDAPGLAGRSNERVETGPEPANGNGPTLSELNVPEGFEIEIYASDVPHARSLARTPRGTLFASSGPAGVVYALVDADRDHKADRVLTVAEGLEEPTGIAFHDGALYIAEGSRILRLDDIESDLDDPPEPALVSDALPDAPHHGWRHVRFGADERLYVGITAPCNACDPDEPIFATIARMSEEGGDFEIFASGVRSSAGFDWHPDTGALWFTDHGRKGLGDDLPPDELNTAPKLGLDFGFPHCYGKDIVDPEFGPAEMAAPQGPGPSRGWVAHQGECSGYAAPAMLLAPHTTAAGIRFYSGDRFPTRHRGSIFIAEHGSTERAEKIGYRVTEVKVEGGRAVSYEPFITGWLDPLSNRAWGRPVDVEIMADGSMLVSDDWNGVVYRVSYRG